jgi:hypothetical protein
LRKTETRAIVSGMAKLTETLTTGATIGAASRPQKKKPWGGSSEPFEKAQFGRDNPRKSKLFPLIFFARVWPGFAGFG